MKQGSQDTEESKTITRLESKTRPGKDHQADETEEIEVAMMCWKNSENSPGKDPYEETDDKEERPDEEMQKLKDEEEHVNSTLHRGNQLKISITEFSCRTEDDTLMLDTQETVQQELLYITDLGNESTKLQYKNKLRKGLKDKKPAVKHRPSGRPSLTEFQPKRTLSNSNPNG